MAINYQSFEEWILGQIPKDPLYTGNLILDHIEKGIWRETGETGLKIYCRFTNIDCQSFDLFLSGNKIRPIKDGMDVIYSGSGNEDLSHPNLLKEIMEAPDTIYRSPADYTHHPTKKADPTIVSGTLIYFDRENLNGRIYPTKTLEGIQDYIEDVHNGNALGCLGYPEDVGGATPLQQVSHRMTDVHYDEKTNTLVGTAKLLETPMGNKAKRMILDALRKGDQSPFVLRSRGIGNLNEKNEVTDFKVLSFDLVPRETDAFKPLEDENNGN